MALAKRYYNCENDCIETLDALRHFYECEADSEDRERMTFEEYVSVCCDKNGALTPIPDALTGKVYFDMSRCDCVGKREMLKRCEMDYGFDEFTPVSEIWDYFYEVDEK